jgi:hypothetical protein
MIQRPRFIGVVTNPWRALHLASERCTSWNNHKCSRADRAREQSLHSHGVSPASPALPGTVRPQVDHILGRRSVVVKREVCLDAPVPQVDRVDFLRRTVRVDRQMVTPLTGESAFGPPKTAPSNRTVPLAQVTVDVLAAHLVEYPAGPTGLVFTTSKGEPWRRTTFAQVISRARADAGLPNTVSFHDLRHHVASVLIAAGCSKRCSLRSDTPTPPKPSPPTATCGRPTRTAYATPSRTSTVARVSQPCHGQPKPLVTRGWDYPDRIVTTATASSPERWPPLFCARARRAPSTWRGPHRPRS